MVLDGVFPQIPDDTIRFYEATLLDEHHWLGLERVVQRRVLRYFRTHGLLDEADADGMPDTRRRRVGQGSGG